ncbi:MAG: hypothetical protein KAI89_02540, partial [Emcibacter sp.]|nr:hypothetical protein [Emcibacter sp.]
MAIVPPTTIDRDDKSLLDHKIVTVERAASDLRRGLAVVIRDDKFSILVQSAELLTDLWIERFRALSGGEPVVGLTYNRANVLHILPRSGNVALIKMSKYMDSTVIGSMADPADDLMRPMLGPFQVADFGAKAVHEAGLKICKIAKLLPAALFSTFLPDDSGTRELLSVSAQDVLNFDHNDAAGLRKVTSAKVPLAGAEKTTLVAFRPDDGGTEHFALIIGDPNRHDPVLTRIHSECFTG